MAQGNSKLKQLKVEEEDEAPQSNWLTSYSDMISLLFALFVVLYGMSKLNEESFRELSEALAKSLSTGGLQTKVPHKQRATDNIEEKMKFRNLQASVAKALRQTVSLKRIEELHQVKRQMERDLESRNLQKYVSIHVEERGIVISLLTDGLLFDLGRAELKETIKKILAVLAPTLKKYPHPIRVEGNTCDLPIQTSEFSSNWELSTARSTQVSKYLIFEQKIEPHRISIIGYGEYKPKYPNDSEANRSRNRRVDIVILQYDLHGDVN